MSELDTLRSVCDRLDHLQKQNRRMRLFCALAVLTPVLIIVACQSWAVSTLNVRKVVIQDKNGKTRIEIGMSYDLGPKGYPVINLFDENGKELTVSAPVFSISPAKESAPRCLTTSFSSIVSRLARRRASMPPATVQTLS